MRLSGWHRLWVLISVIYFVVVVAYSFYTFPKPEKISHKYEFYEKLSPKSLDMIVEKGTSRKDVTTVQMPNGHIISLSNKVTQRDIQNLANEYWSVLKQEAIHQRAPFVLYAFLFWLLPCSLVYTLGWGIGWVHKNIFRNLEGSMDKITKWQLLIFWIGILIIVVMGVYPPVHRAEIVLTELIVKWFIVAIITFGLIITLNFMRRK